MGTRALSNDDGIIRCDTPLGVVTLAASPLGLRGMWFEGQRHFPELSGAAESVDNPLLNAAATQLAEYFTGVRRAFDLALDLSHGTPAQQHVWKALLAIPYGSTTSYAALATSMGRPTAARSVAAAIGRNPLSIIVPCHRVLGSDGSLTGYAGGLQRKQALLELERG
ncbi:methylated-DNA--[protein]-cysteine S-methyltransferase [Xanthomonadaceae bacterium JHOS43]|nr:methylated-DNA--[protein]-cysteine S-methyltransferase [Xanthomonadaceae bacterium JHOS43]MCX7564407.1 methylated-DNA--[protein]-cysteine S-methyltransferase [Xanthomonadaceae bacterium XH05]